MSSGRWLFDPKQLLSNLLNCEARTPSYVEDRGCLVTSNFTKTKILESRVIYSHIYSGVGSYPGVKKVCPKTSGTSDIYQKWASSPAGKWSSKRRSRHSSAPRRNYGRKLANRPNCSKTARYNLCQPLHTTSVIANQNPIVRSLLMSSANKCVEIKCACRDQRGLFPSFQFLSAHMGLQNI